ncbi:hypothetical protein [Lactiplantibacillus plantarum]|uniref:hypothetical protein n=1 Tax=Lactiplantibacillus plantarum TaxID=1590 RepID=UPI003B502A82
MHWLQKHKIKQAVKSNLTGQALIEPLQQVTKDSDPLVIGDKAVLNGFTPFTYTVDCKFNPNFWTNLSV